MSDEHHVTGSADTEHDQHVVEKLGYEARDIVGNRRSILYFAIFHFGGLLATGFLVLGIYWVMSYYAPKFDGEPETSGEQVVSEAAKVQKDPGPDMDHYLHDANERLTTYGWSDEAAGKAHIPIEEAMKRTAAMDLPHRPEGTQ
jgi:hypothetical protein